jgi:hypothetical protein
MEAVKSVGWCKLRSGAWGVRGPSAVVVAGAEVCVSKRDGSSSDVRVVRIVWSDAEVAIAEVAKVAAPSASAPSAYGYRRRGRWAPCGYPGCNPNYCDECDGGGLYARG